MPVVNVVLLTATSGFAMHFPLKGIKSHHVHAKVPRMPLFPLLSGMKSPSAIASDRKRLLVA